MIAIEITAAGLLALLGAWTLRRRQRRPAAAAAAALVRIEPPPGSVAPSLIVDVARIDAAVKLLTERLWKLAFAVPAQMQPLDAAHLTVRDEIAAILMAEAVGAQYFPRRPNLMPQLLHAMDEPGVASDRLSRIVAHDPALAADVLKVANSSAYRGAGASIESIQRAVVILGVDALRALLSRAMLQPVFRATRSNFPRFPRMMWERTERAARAAELYATQRWPAERFEAQLVVLMNALGPLVVYGVALDVYSRYPGLAPNAALCASLTSALAPRIALRVARQWETSVRLQVALEKGLGECLTEALCVGELVGTLSLLMAQSVLTLEESVQCAESVGLPAPLCMELWGRLTPQT
jgi:HDOD domain